MSPGWSISQRREVQKRTLRNLSAKRMIVGHTPQMDGIKSYCKKKSESLIAIDVGLSRAFGGFKVNAQYLEIDANNKILINLKKSIISYFFYYFLMFIKIKI